MNKEDKLIDWEMEEFVNPDLNKKELKLEDFQAADEPETAAGSSNGRLGEIVEEVKAVKDLMETGMDAQKISAKLGICKERVMLIQMSMYGGEGDDNEVAVAHMVMMEEE